MTEKKKNALEQPKVVRPSLFATTFNATSSRLQNLRTLNFIFIGLYAVQIIVLSLTAKSVNVPVATNYLTRDPLQSAAQGKIVLTAASHHLFDLNILYMIIAALAFGLLFHLLAATRYRERYESELSESRNTLRGLQYAIVPSLLMLTIGLLVGVQDITLLLSIVAASVVVHLGCLLKERRSKPGEPIGKLLYGLGLTVGLLPLVITVGYLLAANRYGTAFPTYVQLLVVSSFVIFIASALNFIAQRRSAGKWADFAFGERIAMLLSFVATTSLTWQVFSGILH